MTQQIGCCDFLVLSYGPFQSYHLFSKTGPSNSLTEEKWLSVAQYHLLIFLNSHEDKQLLNSCSHLPINVSLAGTADQSLLTRHQ